MTTMMKDDLHQAIEALEEAAAVLTWPGFAKGAQALRRVLEAVERVERVGSEHCAKACEANAFKIEIRRLRAALARQEEATVKDCLQVAQKEREACFLLAKKYGDHWTADAILSRMQGSTPHGY